MPADFQHIAPFHQQAQDIGDFLAIERAREATANERADDRPLPSEPLQND